MKKTLILGALLLAAAVSAAEKVINLNKVDAWTPGKFLQAEGNVLTAKKSAIIRGKEMVALDDKHTYNFSGELKQAPNCVATSIFVGYQILDKDKKVISMVMASSVKSSTTELAKPVCKGDTKITIKANKMWTAKSHFFIGFDVKEGKLSRNNSKARILNVEKAGDLMIVTLGKPIDQDFAAGIKVRIQNSGGYFYSGYTKTKADWVKFGKELKKNQFWIEAAYVRPLILLNWSTPAKTPASKIGTQFKNMKLTVKEIK